MGKTGNKLWGRLITDPNELAELVKIRKEIYKMSPTDKADAIKNLLKTLEINELKFDFKGSLKLIDVHLSAASNGLELKRRGLEPGTEVWKLDRPTVVLNISYQNTLSIRYTDEHLPKSLGSVSPFSLTKREGA
jgi:hypothetical protein